MKFGVVGRGFSTRSNLAWIVAQPHAVVRFRRVWSFLTLLRAAVHLSSCLVPSHSLPRSNPCPQSASVPRVSIPAPSTLVWAIPFFARIVFVSNSSTVLVCPCVTHCIALIPFGISIHMSWHFAWGYNALCLFSSHAARRCVAPS